MKKNYIAPQTEAIELLGENVIMAVSPGGGGTFIQTTDDVVKGKGGY